MMAKTGNKTSKRWPLRAAMAVHRRLLPDQPGIGWTPYLWLVYLSFFFLEWFVRPVPRWEFALSTGVLAVFLWLYFRSFWQASPRRFWNSLATVGLGLIMTPFNQGAIVFYIYGASTAGTLHPRRLALSTLVLIMLSITLHGWWIDLPLPFWLMTVAIGGLIGLANVYFSRLHREYAALELSHKEVRALAEARERERIGRDLHDLLGQSLSMVTLKAQLARRLIEEDPERVKAELRDIEQGARATLTQVRDAVRGYRRATLTSEAADARITLNSRDIHFDVDLPQTALPTDVDAELALVLREAVTNVLRHSPADYCSLKLEDRQDAWRFHFSDNGRVTSREEGNGLSGIRQRLESLGGEVAFITEGGMQINAHIPKPLDADGTVSAEVRS